MSEYILSIKDLKLDVYIGVSEQERAATQLILVDMSIKFSSKPRAMDIDSIEGTICYDNLITSVLSKYNFQEFKTVEYLAGQLQESIKLMLTDGELISLEVHKKPVIKDFHGVASFKVLES